jgi:hypothetical protein
MGPKVKYDLKPKPKVKAKAKAKAKTRSKLSPINTMARVMGEFETLLCENNNLSRTSQRLIQSYVFKYSILSAPLCSINSVIGFRIAGLHYISEVLLDRVFAFDLEMARACWTLRSGRALEVPGSSQGVVPDALMQF